MPESPGGQKTDRGHPNHQKDQLEAEAFAPDAQSLVRVVNPLGEELAWLRPSLLPGLLDAALMANLDFYAYPDLSADSARMLRSVAAALRPGERAWHVGAGNKRSKA